MLYNLILVDDEDWILNGIQNAIDWEKIGFFVAGTFTNGRDALKYMLKNPPDAILTDIKMPIQDGISLIKEIRGNGLEQVEVVFLSGYDDFKLAQASLRLGAVDYVLKPSAPEQIIEVFSKVRDKLDIRKRSEEEKRAASELAQAGIKVIKEEILNSIKSWNASKYNKFMDLYLEFAERERNCKFMTASIAFNETIKELRPTLCSLRKIDFLEEYIKEYPTRILNKELPDKNIYSIGDLFSLTFIFDNFDKKEAIRYIEDIKRKAYKDGFDGLTCILSDEHTDFCMIKTLYEESLDRLFNLGMPEDVRHLYINIGNDTVLKAAIEDKDQQIVLWSLKNWFLIIDNTDISYQWRLARRLVYSLGIFFLQNGISESAIERLYEILNERDYKNVKESVISFVKVELLADDKFKGRNAHLCKEVAKYISNNYAEDITLNELADKFYISPNYLGTLFKKNMGMGIKEYQTTVRMEQADVLITIGKFKLYQVAQMVGYPNYEYFRKIYYKYMGKNPSE